MIYALNTMARTPSTLLTDCHGRRTSGRNSSNGAMIASAQTPTYAVVATVVEVVGVSAGEAGLLGACLDLSDTLRELAKSANAAAVETCRVIMCAGSRGVSKKLAS